MTLKKKWIKENLEDVRKVVEEWKLYEQLKEKRSETKF